MPRVCPHAVVRVLSTRYVALYSMDELLRPSVCIEACVHVSEVWMTRQVVWESEGMLHMFIHSHGSCVIVKYTAIWSRTIRNGPVIKYRYLYLIPEYLSQTKDFRVRSLDRSFVLVRLVILALQLIGLYTVVVADSRDDSPISSQDLSGGPIR